jgi:ribosome-associated translation inhibitor RaiA
MSLIINTEHFSLSASNRAIVEDILSKLEPMVSPNTNVRLFIKKAPKNLLTAILQVHTRGSDFVISKTGFDLERLVMAVETQIRRKIIGRNQKRRDLRAKKRPIERPSKVG